MFPRVVQYGDGRDAATATAAPSEDVSPAESDRVTRTHTGTSDSPAEHEPALRRPAASPSTDDRLPAPLQYRDPARYEIVAEHGRGGLGRVFRARDKELGRDVALKELLSRGSTTELRFFREALITARLEHPGIVPVHEAGRWPDGTPFYAMKLVAGRPLKALIDECKTLEDRLALLPHVIAVADAIAYAHDRKIIHRDLKPSNIIVGDFGETVVIDWGLAKDISDQAPTDDPIPDGPYRTAAPTSAGDGVTVAGSIVGTPAYMSPEQARGETVDERTDVYALGAILHELAGGTGPRDLIAITRKCMSPSVVDRYPSARSAAIDLRRFVGGARVYAQRYSAAHLLWLWMRRHRTRTIAIVAALAAALVTGLVSLSSIVASRNRAEHNQALAEAASLRSAEERQKAVHALAELTLTKDPTEAYELAAQLPKSPSARLLRTRAAASGIAKHTVRFTSGIYNVTLLPDNRQALVLTSDRRMHLVDLHTGSVEVLDDHMTMPARVAAHGDRIVYSVTSDSFQIVERRSKDAPTVIAHLESMPIEVAHTGTAVYWITAHGQLTERVLSSTEDTIIATEVANLAGRGADIVWCTRTGDLYGLHVGRQQKLARCRPEIQFVAMGDHLVFAETIRSLGIVGRNNRVLFTSPSVESPQPDIDFHVAHSGLVALADATEQGSFVPPGAREASPVPAPFTSAPTATAAGGMVAMWGFADGTVLAYDTSKASLWVHQAHDSAVAGIVVTDSDTFLTFSNTTFRVWSRPSQCATVVAKASPRVFNPAFDHASERFVLDSSEGKGVMVALRPNRATARLLHEHEGIAYGAAWCGTLACTGGWDATVMCSDPDSGTRKVIETAGPVRWVVGGPSQCYYSTATGGVFEFDHEGPLYMHDSEPTRLAYAVKDGLVASVDVTGALITYDARERAVLAKRSSAHSAPVLTLKLEDDTVWTASFDGSVRRWDRMLEPRESHRFPGPAPILDVSRSYLAVSHSSTVLWILDRRSGEHYELDFRTQISKLILSDDSRMLGVATHTGEVYVMEPASGDTYGGYRFGSDVRGLQFVRDDLFAVGFEGTVLRMPATSGASF